MATTDSRLTGRFELLGLGVALALLSQLGIGLFVLLVVSAALVPIWVGMPMLVGSVALTRLFADGHRTWAGVVLGTKIPRPYLPLPAKGWFLRFRAAAADPATWRDLAWLVTNCVLGALTGIIVLTILAGGLFYLTLPAWWPLFAQLNEPINFVGFIWVSSEEQSFLIVPFGVALLGLWWWSTPKLMRLNARITSALLAPTAKSRLAIRVRELSDSRADSVDAHAAELRRIERDLHDGAQARLVALGMSLGMAEEIVTDNPAVARELLAEARQSTTTALAELRDLVRGIHPPVLADRGIEGAVQALALANPLPIEVTVDLPGRPQAPVESAVYFAVAEALANALKYSGATSGWIRVSYSDGRLSVMVGDDGCGGATVSPGGGLHGIERRLSAFDGTLLVTSPAGGPTILSIELPCELN